MTRSNLTNEEWAYGVDFLYRAGQISDENRNEFMVVFDCLGFSSIVDLIRDATGTGDGTQASPLGPFFIEGLPICEYGHDLGSYLSDIPVLLHGQILGESGSPVAGAEIDFDFKMTKE